MLAPLHTLNISNKDAYLVFTAFESETDHLPLSRYQGNWDQNAYAEKIKELKRFEDQYREEIIAACRTLIEFLKDQQY